MADLKPCPFCGGNATIDAQFGREWWVECDDCAASTGGMEESREAAIVAWNRRTDDPIRDPSQLDPPPIYDEHYAATQDDKPVQDAASVAEECAQLCDDVEERQWYGYENPNTFDDAKRACAAAICAYAQRLKEGK